MKIPKCQFCHYKMYVVENRRKAIGYLCPNCNFTAILHPTEHWNKMRNNRSAQINRRSFSGSKPKFGKRRMVTKCGNCHKSKYVECRKIKQTKKRIEQRLNLMWQCICTKCDISWGQNHPKIEMVKIPS